MTTKNSFGQWLKQRRKTLDLTREDLAGRIGCAAVTLKKIETDERRPSKQIAALLAEYLNIPPDERDAFIQFARAETLESSVPRGTPFHPSSNLPAQPTLLIGRDEDVTAIGKRLLRDESRLLTLTGPPGIGKTRLALQVATQVLDDFADGVFFVALAPISDASLVASAIATTLGIAEGGPRTPLERLQTYLRDKQLLLVLDNFEQILAAAPDIAELLAACPSLKLLITSRSPLRIRQERQISVSPLAVPDLAYLPDVKNMAHYSAVTLFLERAQAVKPDFALTQENAPTIAAICTRLDGLPLAIELISARVKLLSPVALLERLAGRLMLQSDGLRDIEARHRTLNAAIDWSYQLLNADEQILFRRLGVFVGGWTLEAAESVCTENLTLNILDGLASLLDKNLVKHDTRSEGEPRFMMLETIREYVLEQLTVSGELEALQEQHTNYFVILAEGANAHAFGREQVAWFDRVEAELDNVRAAFTRSLEAEIGLRLAAALGWFFSERNHWGEGLEWLERTLAANQNASTFQRSKALHSAGALAGILHDWQRAGALLDQGLALARATNDSWNIAWSLTHMAIHTEVSVEQSVALLEKSLALFRELDDSMGVTIALFRQSWYAFKQHDYTYMRLLLEEAALRAHEAGDRVITAWVAFALGRFSWGQDRNLKLAKTHLENSLLLFREARIHVGYIDALIWLAAVERAEGNLARAQEFNEEALISLREYALPHSYPYAPFVWAGLAELAMIGGQFDRAARLLGAANSRALSTNDYTYKFPTFDSDVAEVRAQLGEVAFGEAWAAGEAMTPGQAVDYALDQSENESGGSG